MFVLWAVCQYFAKSQNAQPVSHSATLELEYPC